MDEMYGDRTEHLESALDGLIAASAYAERVGLPDLALRISMCYQELGANSPDEDWDWSVERDGEIPDSVLEEMEPVYEDPEIDED